MNFEKNIGIKKKLLTLSTLVHLKYFRHLKYSRHSKYFRYFCLTLGTLGTSSILGTFPSCSKSSALTEPEEQRPITEDTVWESGNDYIIRENMVGKEDRKIKVDFQA
jgi:hypothetical protein